MTPESVLLSKLVMACGGLLLLAGIVRLRTLQCSICHCYNNNNHFEDTAEPLCQYMSLIPHRMITEHASLLIVACALSILSAVSGIYTAFFDDEKCAKLLCILTIFATAGNSVVLLLSYNETDLAIWSTVIADLVYLYLSTQYHRQLAEDLRQEDEKQQQQCYPDRWIMPMSLEGKVVHVVVEMDESLVAGPVSDPMQPFDHAHDTEVSALLSTIDEQGKS